MRDSSTGSIRSPWTPRETSTPAKWKTANGFRSSFPQSEKEGRSATMGGWPRLTFFFPLDGDHQREDSTVPIHRTDKNRGCPTRRVYAWGAVSYHQHRFSRRIKPGTTRSKAPRVNPTRRAPNSSTHLTSGPPAAFEKPRRSGHPEDQDRLKRWATRPW